MRHRGTRTVRAGRFVSQTEKYPCGMYAAPTEGMVRLVAGKDTQ